MPKKPTRKADPKEVYRLWYEYLKRSADYEEFCNWIRENKPQEFSVLPSFSPSTTEAHFNFLTDTIPYKPNPPLPEHFRKKSVGNTGKQTRYFASLYLNFRDIYKIPFEEWWANYIKYYAERKNEVLPGDPEGGGRGIYGASR